MLTNRGTIEDSIATIARGMLCTKSMTRAILRMANYFDGVKLSYKDELDIIGKNSLKNDIADIFNSEAKEHIKSRRESVRETLEGIK